MNYGIWSDLSCVPAAGFSTHHVEVTGCKICTRDLWNTNIGEWIVAMGDSGHNLVIWQQCFMFEEKVPIKAKEAGVGAS